jgi:hypothetical protein
MPRQPRVRQPRPELPANAELFCRQRAGKKIAKFVKGEVKGKSTVDLVNKFLKTYEEEKLAPMS